MYSNIVLNVFSNPKNIGRISKPDGIADCYNVDSTAHVEFSLRIDSGVILDCKFRAQANPYIVAICSTMTNMVKGKMCSMLFLDPYSIKKELGDETEIDIMFCIDCLKMALQDYREKLEKENKQAKNKQIDNLDSVDLEQVSAITEQEKPVVDVETKEEDDFGDVDFISGLFDDEFFEEE